MVSDQVNKPEEERKPLPVDEDLPGMGQHYCLHSEYVSVLSYFVIMYTFGLW
jgi:hypothetical protein